MGETIRNFIKKGHPLLQIVANSGDDTQQLARTSSLTTQNMANVLVQRFSNDIIGQAFKLTEKMLTERKSTLLMVINCLMFSVTLLLYICNH